LFFREPQRQLRIEEIPQKVMQLEILATCFAARDQQLPLVEPVEELAGFLRADQRIGELGADLGKKIEFEERVLVDGRQCIEEISAEHVEKRILVFRGIFTVQW
jgi:hypothetical protein